MRNSRFATSLLIACVVAAIALLVVRTAPRPPLRTLISQSTALSAQSGELLRLTLAADGQYRLWVGLDALPSRLPAAALLYEDRWFYGHPGVNPVALARAALEDGLGHQRIGASTVTMQLARRLYHLNTRSGMGKLRQIALAFWLEARYSKHDILEAYLNLAPYGGNVEGVGAASLVYFGIPAARLSVPQIMTLAVIPQNPRERNPHPTGAGSDGDRARSRVVTAGSQADTAPSQASAARLRADVARSQADMARSQPETAALTLARRRLWVRWIAQHPDDARFSTDMEAPVVARTPEQLPFLAPHFTDALLRRVDGDVSTTLDLARQRTVERILVKYIETHADLGIRNAGALLLDVDDGAATIRAYVGSADYRDARIDGQVNAVTAKRSPGSALKPFIYGLALDEGLLHPRTILKDTPTAFGPFSPENFDGRFMGPITAEEALIRSRNVPAVTVASELSRPDLYDFLRAAGVSHLKSEQHYGLALALGGGEVSMEELGRLYALLVNGGKLPALRSVATDPAADGERLLSPEASFIVLDMLHKNPRPDTGAPASPAVAWKTGTSWGFHDAWSVGVFGRQVLLVWIGNFDNTSNPAFVGVQAAAPLLFRTIDALRSQGLDRGDIPQPRPANLARVEVCAASGDLPNAACPQTASTWYIPGKSPIRLSTLHQFVYLDAAGRRVCGPGPQVRQEVYEFWTSDMLRLFRDAGMPRRLPPPDPGCGPATADALMASLHIVSPLRGVVYTQRLEHPVPLALRADSGSNSRAVFWFAGNAFIGRAAAGESLAWTPTQPGRYLLRAVDDGAGADTRELNVEWVR